MPSAMVALHVLVVDDEPLIRWAMSETLQRVGYTVAEAGSAHEALDQLKDGPAPDVVLLDLRLPDSNDLELLATIRHRSPDSAVVLATASKTPEVLCDAKRLGAVAVVDKPVDMTYLPAMVASARQREVVGGHDA